MSKRCILNEEQAIFSRQKRYLSEKSIIVEIDEAKAKQHAITERADRLLMAHKSRSMDELTAEDHKAIVEHAVEAGKFIDHDSGLSVCHELSEILYARAERMEHRICNLGHKLAAFRTELLSFTNDRAVV